MCYLTVKQKICRSTGLLFSLEEDDKWAYVPFFGGILLKPLLVNCKCHFTPTFLPLLHFLFVNSKTNTDQCFYYLPSFLFVGMATKYVGPLLLILLKYLHLGLFIIHNRPVYWVFYLYLSTDIMFCSFLDLGLFLLIMKTLVRPVSVFIYVTLI